MKCEHQMDKFEECIIHIGTAKTGTTSLQQFFHMNRTNLAKKDIFYPETFGEKNHPKLAIYALDDQKIVDLPFITDLTNIEQIKNFRKEIMNSLQDEINNQGCSKLLLSDEGMSSALQSVLEVKSLKKFLDNFVKKYKVVVYIRPQHERAISGYSTVAKVGFGRQKLLPLSNKEKMRFNYEKLLELWEEVFGHENIIPRIYSLKDFLDGDIKKDFINFLGLDWF